MITSFATGLLVSAAVCGVVYLSDSSQDTKKPEKVVAQPSEEEMKNSLSDSGYIILTNEEWERQLAATEVKPEEKKEESEPEQTKDKETVIYRTIVNVAPGMTSIDVGNALAKGKIIDSGRTFFDEVEKRGLANQLKPGTFELESSMTMDEVISIIFK